MCIFATTFQYLGQEYKLKPLFSNNIKIFRIMRKYLMTGVAALAICAAFTSCSSKEELYNPDAIEGMNKEKVIENYNARFLAYVGGSIAPDQDWGFGSGTRAGAEPNANMWADEGYKAPRELSEGQKTRVMAYFQANPHLTYVDPKFKNFFVQQVYKGYTSPGAISAEKYKPTDTNNPDIIGSDHMDHLTFGIKSDGTAKDHDNNFNHGRYSSYNAADPNGTPRDNVQNWPGVSYLNDNGNGTHQDHIMLMLGSSTESVGFQDSNGSLVHLDCCANAGASVIDAWALAHEDSLKAIGKFGETVTDEWKRSFVGLDYEQQTINELYTGGTAKALDFCDGNSQYILYRGQLYAKNDFANFDLKDPGNNAVKYIKDDVSNMGIAEYIKYTKSDNTVGKVTKNAYNYKLTKDQFKTLYNYDITNGEAGLYNLDMILGYVYESALPTQNDGNWVKNIGGRDYVFSDWIVTLTEAEQETPPTPPTRNYTLRVLAEDLTFANSVSGVEITESDAGADFDFNDVVFDVAHVTGGTADENGTWIRLMAAGGTLPLYIGTVAQENEVHFMFNVSETTMVNTYNGRHSEKAPVEFKYSNDQVIAKNIAIIVIKDGIQFTLSAERGEPASKIAVDLTANPNFDWANERQSIKERYPSFAKWAQEGQTKISEWWN